MVLGYLLDFRSSFLPNHFLKLLVGERGDLTGYYDNKFSEELDQ